MNYQEINQAIEELAKSNVYNNSQLEAIKYAYNIRNFNVNLILDPSIPSNMMLMYVKLVQTYKIDISKYINGKWHLKGFDDKQLYYLIAYDSKGYDISKITPNMSVEQIQNTMNNIQKSAKLNESYNKSNMSISELSKLKEYNLDNNSINFLLKIGEKEDLTNFLSNDLTGFSYEQIKYLYSAYSTGANIKNILNPKLTVEQMKNKMLYSKESIAFTQEIMENHNSKKK